MIIEKKGEIPQIQFHSSRAAWLRILLSILLGGVGLWFVGRNVNLSELGLTISLANPVYVLIGSGLTVIIMLGKAWRWQFLFYPPQQAPSLRPLWQALVVGQFINLLAPFRLGEVARVYSLYQQTRSSKAQTLGTLVVEKTLDMIMLAMTLFILLPIMVVPSFISERGPILAAVSLAGFFFLYLLAYQTERVIGWIEQFAHYLPTALKKRVMQLAVTGLQGLAALRSQRISLLLIVSSALIAFLSLLTPLILFHALQLPFGLVEATLLNLVVTIGLVPASTPAKVGVFEWLVLLVLRQFGMVDETLMLGYALLYHLVVILPQIALGSIEVSRTNWRR